ncbi:hypothetical protein NIES3804_34600 [Microcystis aeruginosa NIES-3804]|uniref:DUF2062 domain-containing protein n=1 Tax=Microcystis aeruginosa NIES-3804 TaxID=2517783 RepID=A0A6H9GMX3_MICAE|nr:DUF2062 domain-containing protein [Microcystis aeruginosa]GCL51874.1 hypothetical protein NIES3804_34600 [Microcystis aeruginosa NIES-3804]
MPENMRSRSLKAKNKGNNLINRLMRSCRYWWVRLVRLQGHPREIARGFALGVFSGFFPWMGLQIIIAIFLATLFRANKIAAAAGTYISNPVTDLPIFLFNYRLGEFILGQSGRSNVGDIFQTNQSFTEKLASSGGQFLLTLFFGCLLSATVFATITYFVSYRLVHQRYHQRQTRRKR